MLTTIKQLQVLGDVARHRIYKGTWFRSLTRGNHMNFPHKSVLNKLRVARLVRYIDGPIPTVLITNKGLEVLDRELENLFPELARAVNDLYRAEMFALGSKDLAPHKYDPNGAEHWDDLQNYTSPIVTWGKTLIHPKD